ncbi:MAG: YraN family protein [Neorhizobium sp.]|jgi:putative endonuclease|nr:YraN family protein [Neorhizobium sp.]
MGKGDHLGLKRKRAERRGRLSEYVAAAFLIARGYRILAIRYRTRAGEVDLVARKGDLIAFVEVKARRVESAALDAVGYRAQQRIRATGDIWLSRRPDHARLSCRYDVIVVRPWRLPRHFVEVF